MRRYKWFNLIWTILNILFTFIIILNIVNEESEQAPNSKQTLFSMAGKPHKQLLIIVLTSPRNFEQRLAIRETWPKLAATQSELVLIMFALGTALLPNNVYDQLQSEKKQYGDLLLLPNLLDSYQNLTQKLLMSYIVATELVEFDFLMKVDDDSFVILDSLLENLSKQPKSRLYWGFFDGRAPVQRSGKWMEKEFVLCDRYLPYAVGGGYILSRDLVNFIVQNSHMLSLYNNEDTSNGIWLSALNISRIHDVRFDTEFRSRGCFNSYLVTHKQTALMMRKRYNLLKLSGVSCNPESRVRYSYDYNWNVPPTKCCNRTISNII